MVVAAAAVVVLGRGWNFVVADQDERRPAALLAAAPGGGAGVDAAPAVQESTYQALEVFNGALMLIREQYLEPVDPAFLMDGAVRGIFEALDADSAYLRAEDLDRYRARGSATAGIGVGLQKRYYLHVDDVLPGSPAAAAGIEGGVAITAIDGHNTRELRFPVARLLLAGRPGTTVELSLRGATDSESRRITLERAVLDAPPVEHRMEREDIGLVRIRRFHEKTPTQLVEAVRGLLDGGARGLILDLRGSRGSGVGCEAGAEAAGVFMAGTVGEVVERTEAGEESAALETPPGEVLFAGPLAVIVNPGTVCPGEVLAAALKSREAADVLGRRTAGRTGRPEVIELAEGDAILLSTAHIRGVDGEDILGVGVLPSLTPADLEIESADLDEDDPELDLAIRALERRGAGSNGPA